MLVKCLHNLSDCPGFLPAVYLYYHLLKKWEADNSPRTPEEEPHPRFVEAIQKKTYVEYLLDLFLYESEEEQKAWIAEHTAEITHLERRLKSWLRTNPPTENG